jgi:UDP-4-amino-4,6-dideoxy-N-acetyl-beta-L-altrosamine N-acetyltransferase
VTVALLEGEKVRLREIREADLAHIVRWRNDPRIMATLFSHRPLSEAEQLEWFCGLTADRSRVSFLVETPEGRPVGQGGFIGIDHRNRTAELGVMIGEREQQGRGLGTEAVRLLVNYGFAELNLHRIALRVLEGNPSALKLYRGLGFRDEGVLRQAAFKNGRFRDVLLLGLLENEA